MQNSDCSSECCRREKLKQKHSAIENLRNQISNELSKSLGSSDTDILAI